MAWTCQRRPAQGAAAIDFGKTIAATDSAALARRQPSPIERHVPLPDDKVVLAELVRAHRLVHRHRIAGIAPQRVTMGPPGSLMGGTPASEVTALLESRIAARDKRKAEREQGTA
jgi:hypothetical protein